MKKTTWTVEKLNKELELEHIAKEELENKPYNDDIKSVMKNIENLRKKRLKELRKSNGVNKRYTQKDVAERAGIALTTYKNYICGKSHDISLRTILKITVILRCNLQEILPY